MTPALYLQPTPDLAGDWFEHPTTGQLHQRIRGLIDRYLTLDHLRDRLQDLPRQFDQPQVRPWQAIDWKAIHPDQVTGIDLAVFQAILIGAINTEAPIRDYTQASRQYLEALHPQMARFVGGAIAPDGHLIEPGLWEKEERQHTPALLRIYTQLSGEKVTPTPHSARPYHPVRDPRSDLYRHGLHRIATEYGATCLYLWLMAHTTGPLQRVLEELLLDEINHMTKFWGFGCWAFPEASLAQTGWVLLQSSRGQVKYRRDRSSLIGTLDRMTQVLAWPAWSWTNRGTFAVTCMLTLQRMHQWLQTLTQSDLNDLFVTH